MADTKLSALTNITGANLVDADELYVNDGGVSKAITAVELFNYMFRSVANGNSGTTLTVDWTNGLNQTVTLDNNCTFSFTAPTINGWLTLLMVQDATGGRTVTWPTVTWFNSGIEPTWDTTATGANIARFFYDGSTYFGHGETAYL